MGLQVIFNGIISGSIYALIAIGFSLVYSLQRFFYIAHGSVVAVGAFAFFSFFQLYHWNPIFAFLGAAVVTMVLSSAIEIGVHSPLRRRRGTGLLFFLASTALFILIENALLLIFGPSVKTYKLPLQQVITIGNAIITPSQSVIFGTSVFVVLLLYLFMTKTKLGKAIRAISDDTIAASAVGINVDKIYLVVINLSAILACIAGVLMSLERDLLFDMGTQAILVAIVSSIIGGIGNVPAAVIGGFALGLIENTSIWFLPTGYKQVITFGILIGFLLLRPQGIIGRRLIEK